MDGKALPFRRLNLEIFRLRLEMEAEPPKILRNRYGKAEPYRLLGGKAASLAFVLDFPLEITSTFCEE